MKERRTFWRNRHFGLMTRLFPSYRRLNAQVIISEHEVLIALTLWIAGFDAWVVFRDSSLCLPYKDE